MAAYRFEAQVIGRSSGRSAVNAAAYRSTSRLEDERTGQTFDYTRKAAALLSEIMAPGDAPAALRDRSELWNTVERGEKRKDAQLCREILLNLPHELTEAQRAELVRGFVRDEFVALGMVADLNIHAPDRKGDHRNAHAHVMLTMRSVTAAGFGAKVREWNDPTMLDRWREAWAEHQNRALERAGRAERVDHRSLEARGIDREPEPKQGPVATAMEQEGKRSKAGGDRRATKARNAERDELKAEAQVIDLALARAERQAAAETAQRQNAQRERDRFSGWANARRAKAQTTRLDAEISQGRTHQRERLELDNQHAATRPQRERQQTALDDIAARQQRAKGWGLAGFVYRASGRAGKDEAQAEAIKATMRDQSNRQAEQLQALNVRHAAERKQLAQHHGRQSVRLEQGIEKARARHEREGWQDQRGNRQENTRPEAENLPVDGLQASEGHSDTPEPSDATHEAENGQDEAAKQRTADEQAEAARAALERLLARTDAEIAARNAEREGRDGDSFDLGRTRDYGR